MYETGWSIVHPLSKGDVKSSNLLLLSQVNSHSYNSSSVGHKITTGTKTKQLSEHLVYKNHFFSKKNYLSNSFYIKIFMQLTKGFTKFYGVYGKIYKSC